MEAEAREGENGTPLAMKTEGEASSRGMQAPLGPGEGRTRSPFSQAPRRTQPTDSFVPAHEPGCTSDLQNPTIINLGCFKPPNWADFFQQLQEMNAHSIMKVP